MNYKYDRRDRQMCKSGIIVKSHERNGQTIYGRYNCRKGGVSKKCNHDYDVLELLNGCSATKWVGWRVYKHNIYNSD